MTQKEIDHLIDWLQKLERKIDKVIENHGQRIARLEATIAALRKHRVRRVGAMNCTGSRATSYLRSNLPEALIDCPVGTVFCSPEGESR